EVAAIENMSNYIKSALKYSKEENFIMFVTHEPCVSCKAHLKEYNLNYKLMKKTPGKEHLYKDEPTGIDKTLAERGSRYGDFADNAKIHDSLMGLFQAQPNWEHKLRDIHRSALDVMAQKIARILNGDPEYKD